MRRAMQQFRNVKERRFGSWHGVLGLGKMLHRLPVLASSEVASRGLTGVKHAAVWKCYIYRNSVLEAGKEFRDLAQR